MPKTEVCKQFEGYRKIIASKCGDICYNYALGASRLIPGQRPVTIQCFLNWDNDPDDVKLAKFTGWGDLMTARILSDSYPARQEVSNGADGVTHTFPQPGQVNANPFLDLFQLGDVLIFVNRNGDEAGRQSHFMVNIGKNKLFAGTNNNPDIIAGLAEDGDGVRLFLPRFTGHHILFRLPANQVDPFCQRFSTENYTVTDEDWNQVFG